MTYDGINVSPIDSSKNGTYCESSDGKLSIYFFVKFYLIIYFY